ncbi:hypothetical protein EI94DRAFT_1729724 [Lactarius quietus]|nr:hypothetical protein EI94DRAFT_1729724 [Lactarius quietus]
MPVGDPSPPLGVKLICYRLLTVTTETLWGCRPLIQEPIGCSDDTRFASSAVRNYRPGKNYERFFRVDLAPAFGHSAKNFLMRVASAMAFVCDILVFHPFISLFVICVCLLLARYLPEWGVAVVSIGLTLPVVIIFMGLVVRATSRRSSSRR